MKLLMVEDEPALSAAAVPTLEKGGFLVDVVECLTDAFSAIAVFTYDLILLDRNLPDGDGMSFLRSMRKNKNDTPVIIISAAKNSVADRVEGLDGGADDYLTKPIEQGELIARVKTLLRRPKTLEAIEINIGNLAFDLNARTAKIDGQPIRIARRELGMLEHLVRSQGRVVSREQIEQNSYGFDEVVSINAIDVSMHRLRRILSTHKSNVAVHTVRGIGYILQERVNEPS